MTRAPVIMAAVGAAAAAGSVFVFTRPAADEGLIYAKRIAGTMLAAFALIMLGFATALAAAGGGA
jgi:hypothetical protein